MKTLLLLLLCGCASWAPTQRAIVSRQAASVARHCVMGSRCDPTQVRACIEESAAICEEAGFEGSCGTDLIFTDPIACPIK